MASRSIATPQIEGDEETKETTAFVAFVPSSTSIRWNAAAGPNGGAFA